MGGHSFGNVYLMFTVVFGRFRSVAETPKAKVESAARGVELEQLG